MAGVKHFFQGVFLDECALEFFDNFELVTEVSGWDNSTTLIYLSLY